jgi:phage tail tube protein FII
MKVEVEVESGMEKEDKEIEWKVECAAQDLLRAEKVKEDKELYMKAIQHLGKQKKTIESIEDIKALYKKKLGEEKEE